ncbi:MAG TPA: hypothetical protein P5191_16630 [Ruminococcus sp.]|nr:hypothetical protein [Ruminococcus flavefaciens]HRR78406.1 hypothetical protein [Ruminococcus sp.]
MFDLFLTQSIACHTGSNTINTSYSNVLTDRLTAGFSGFSFEQFSFCLRYPEAYYC